MAARAPSPQARRDLQVARAEELYGFPEDLALAVSMHKWEFDLLRYSKRDGRHRDVTILIPVDGRLACIVKHQYPPGVARPPSGGVIPGEALDSAAEREAFEETGLRVRVTHYLLRVACDFSLRPGEGAPPEKALAEAWHPSFTGQLAQWAAGNPARAGAVEPWESHVFWAEPRGGELRPRDTREVKEVRLVAPRDLEGPVHERMRASDVGGFEYRVALAEAALSAARRRGLL